MSNYRNNKDLYLGISKSILAKFVACFLLLGALGGITSIGSENFESSHVILIIILIIGGISLLRLSKKLKFNANKYKKYVAVIINENEQIIDNIAVIMGLPIDVVKKDIQKMIDTGYLEGAYIDEDAHEVVFSRKSHIKEDDYSDINTNNEESEVEVVKCKCCGAKNMALENIEKCAYCDSAL